MHYHDLFDKDLFNQMAMLGYIKATRHPYLDLSVFNYTTKCTIDAEWNSVTKACRGLIVDDKGIVVARPFAKFFNLAEHDPAEEFLSWPFVVYDKIDGSLGILYSSPLNSNSLSIATRGSFTSDQALHATGLLRKKYPETTNHPEWTAVFEIVYPANRIVVDYGKTDDLIFLGAVNNDTGEEYSGEIGAAIFNWTGPVVKGYPSEDMSPYEVLDALGKDKDDGSEEGYVIKFLNYSHPPLRVKVKHAEYVRLHKIITNISTKVLWEALRDGHDVNAIIKDLSPDVQGWAQDVVDDLVTQFVRNKSDIYWDYDVIMTAMKIENWDQRNPAHKAEFARRTKDKENPSLLFSLYDDKPVNAALWKGLQPKYGRPFEDDETVTVADLDSSVL